MIKVRALSPSSRVDWAVFF
uniref:Uncharacterized protein n=1 Tax=Arundo donax TaxID=35708 RepID=A0A0A9F9C9_ARUDO